LNRNEFERAFAHIREVETDIAESEAVVGSDRFLRIKYEDLCDRPNSVLEEIAEFSEISLNAQHDVPDRFPVSSVSKLSEADFEQLRAAQNRTSDDLREGTQDV